MPVDEKSNRRNNEILPISVMQPGGRFSPGPDFDADKLEKNVYRFSNGMIYAKIPKITGRIFKRKAENRDTTYIELVISTAYDPEKKQMRNRKVIIGEDLSDFFPGLMIPNQNYFSYFGRDGSKIPEKLQGSNKQAPGSEGPDEEKEKPKGNRIPPEKEKSGAEGKETETIQTQRKETARPAVPKERTVDEIRESLLKKEKLLDEQLRKLRQQQQEADRALRQLQESREELDELIESRKFENEEKARAHINLLDNILGGHLDVVKEQAKRRPDTFMRFSQIRTINEVLQELRKNFSDTEAEDYLHLAEEPREDDLEHYPGTTYGEMAILLSAYTCTISAFRYDHLYRKHGTPVQHNSEAAERDEEDGAEEV